MLPFLVGTNWKMNKTMQESRSYLDSFLRLARRYSRGGQARFFVIPPHTHLQAAGELLAGEPVLLGAQNAHWMDFGPYTGEISPVWLKELGVNIIELGHSERRQYYGENDFDLNLKVKAAQRHNLISLLCIGENAREKACGVTEEVLRYQLKAALHEITPAPDSIWVAYEPVWAIGEGSVPADPDYVAWVHARIARCLQELLGEIAERTPILYGGSVSPENCAELAGLEHVNGLFIGRSAWDLTAFTALLSHLEHAGVLSDSYRK